MKYIIGLILIALLGVAGYCVYLGIAESGNNDAGMIALDAGNLAQSVTDTFKDGANVLAKKAKEAKDSAVVAGSKAVDSVKGKTEQIAIEVKDAVVEKAESVKEGIADVTVDVVK